jgi:hypothetical protein
MRQTIFSMLSNFQFSIFNFQSKLKIFLTLSVFLLSTFYLLSPTFAEASAGKSADAASQAIPVQANTTVLTSNTNPDVPNNLHNWTQTVMIETMSALTCQIAGVDPINPKQPCLGADQKSGKIGFLPSVKTGGAIGFMGNMISVLYTPPLHTSDYFKDLAQNFGISKKTYAAPTTGTGFQSLTPLIGIWSAFRNIVYLILVVIFVVIGLAIMLRVKIDPRTVMTIQNQIPKIIVGILAVTFSFAIAGFLIDIMWILIYLIYNVITQAAGYDLISGKLSGTPFGVIGSGNSWSILWEASKGIGVTIADLLGFDSLKNMLIHPSWWQSIISPILGLGGLLTGILGFLGGLIAFLIIGIALLVALFKLWFTLIKAYVFILLDVVLAPFWIIGGIVPGSPISLTGWLKDISANLLAFPVTIAMFMFAILFKDIFGKDTAGQYFFPPLIGNANDMGPNLIGAIISLGIILITPNVVNLLKQMFKAPKTDMGFGKAIGAGSPGTMFNKAGQIGLSISGIKTGVGMLPFAKKAPAGGGGRDLKM